MLDMGHLNWKLVTKIDGIVWAWNNSEEGQTGDKTDV